MHSTLSVRFARFVPALALSLGLCALSAFSACNSTSVPLGAGNDGISTGRLATVNPLEVVVQRVENQSGVAGVPLETIRARFHAGLVKARYTPLALEYVDRNARAVEAGYKPGELGEQATLRVVITGWDDSQWRSRSRLVVDAEVYLLDANEPELTKALWGGHVSRTVDLSRQAAVAPTANDLIDRAVAAFVDGVLDSLPPRNPER